MKQPAQQRIESVQSQKAPGDLDPAKAPPPQEIKLSPSPARRRTVAAKSNGSVKSFFRDTYCPPTASGSKSKP